MNYYVLTSGEDGIAISEYDSKEELQARLNSDLEDGIHSEFLANVPEIDKGCWYQEDGVLIIKGEIVVPKEEKVVKEYKL